MRANVLVSARKRSSFVDARGVGVQEAAKFSIVLYGGPLNRSMERS